MVMKHPFRLVFPAVCGALFFYLLAYKVGNTDFWWHIKAGDIYRSGTWILTDPFAYTRVGEPYLANHEWLAQIILSLSFAVGGWVGITVLRTALVGLAFSIPLLLHKRHIWIHSAFALLAVVGARPTLTDRPQLFTFLFFSLFVALCFAYLELPQRKRKQVLLLLPFIIITWSNMHGAASLVALPIFGALLIQRFMNGGTLDQLYLFASIPVLALATLLTPSGTENVQYILTLFSDQSSSLIAEWQPASWGQYFLHTLPLWITSVLALWYGKKNVFFSTALLVGMAILSRSAGRHETLFLLAALCVTVYQLRYVLQWNAFVDWVSDKKKRIAVLSVLCLPLLAAFTHVRSYDINRVDHLFGYGVFQPASGAAAFLEHANVEGNMFNNYNIGGQLLWHDIPVFLDGRNLDYGYEYIHRAVNAGVDANEWLALDAEYGFTHAAIAYYLQADMHPIPYTDLLDADAHWHLVYLDDWVAVYINDAENGQTSVIDEYAITTLTPAMLHRLEIPSEMGLATFRTMEAELNRMIEANEEGVQAHIYLATLYTALQQYNLAEVVLNTAIERQPNNYRIYLAFAKLRMEQGRWNDAWSLVKQAKRTAGYTGVQINNNLLQQIKEKL